MFSNASRKRPPSSELYDVTWLLINVPMDKLYINQLSEGERIVSHFLVKSKQLLSTKSGKSYLSLILQDKTGSVSAKVWDESQPEPANWQVQAWDDSGARLISGRVGVWSMNPGAKYWDNVLVTGLGVPTAVQVASFGAVSQSGSIRLEWQGAGELDTIGYHLYRSTSPHQTPMRITEPMINSQGPFADFGDTAYEYLDTDVEVNSEYFYWLDVIDSRGEATRFGPEKAIAGVYRYFIPRARR